MKAAVAAPVTTTGSSDARKRLVTRPSFGLAASDSGKTRSSACEENKEFKIVSDNADAPHRALSNLKPIVWKGFQKKDQE